MGANMLLPPPSRNNARINAPRQSGTKNGGNSKCLLGKKFVLKRLTEETSGDYTVATDESHYRDSLMAQCTPPPTQPGRGALFADLVQMGFPAETQVCLKVARAPVGVFG